jgi:hypothetical protein
LRDHLLTHGLTPGEIVDGGPGPKQEMDVTDPRRLLPDGRAIDDETVSR